MAKPAQSTPAITRARHAQNTAHAKATKPARAIKAALSSSLLLWLALPSAAFAAQNVTGSVSSGGNLSNSSNDTFYVLGGQNNTSIFGVPSDVRTNYSNGTLIFGNSTKQASSSQTYTFRANVYAYTTIFGAKDIFLTGNINTSKATPYVRYFDLQFQGQQGIEANGLKLDSVASNFAMETQNGNVDIKNSSLKMSESSAYFTAQNGAINIDNSTLNISSNNSYINAKNGDLDIKNGSSVNISDSTVQMTATNGTLKLDESSSITMTNTDNVNISAKNIALNGRTYITTAAGITAGPVTNITATESLSAKNLTISLNLRTASTNSANINLNAKSIDLSGSALSIAGTTSDPWATRNISVAGSDSIKLTGSSITLGEGNSNLSIKSANGAITLNNSQITLGSGMYGNSATFEGKSINFTNNSSVNVGNASMAGQVSYAKFNATDDISTDSTSSITSSADHTEFVSTNGSINLAGTTTISGGGATVDAYVNLQASKNISAGNLDVLTNQGNSQFNIKAGGDINISNLVYRANLGLAANAGYANFEGKNITINGGSIESNRGIDNSTDTAGELNTTFRAEENITLNNFNIRLVSGLAGIGSPDSLTFIGKNLTHTGRIYVADGWQHTWEGVTFDFSGITESASVGDMSVVAAIIKTNKNFKANSLVVQARQTNGGFGGAGSLIYTAENANLTFENLTLNDSGGTGYTSRLTFYDANGSGSFVKGSTLNATNLTLGTMAGLYANNIETANIQNLILKSQSTANFSQLNIINGGSIVMDVNSAINIAQSFSVDVKQSSNAVNNFGAPLLYVVNAGKNMSNLNIQAGSTTPYRFITASGGISYNFTTASGATSKFYCDGSASTQAQCDYIKNSIAIYEGDKVDPTTNADGSIDYTAGRVDLATLGSDLGLRFEKVVDYSTIGIKALADNPDNPYDIGDIRYYIWQKGGTSKGDEYVSKIAGISTTSLRNETIEQVQNGQKVLDSNGDVVMVETTNSDIFQWMQFLSIRSKGITWTGTNIMDYDIDFFYDTATQLYNTLGQVASTERKSNMASSTRLAADIAKIQRLVKLSRGVADEGDTRFAQYLRSLKGKRFASNDAGGVASGAAGGGASRGGAIGETASDYAESSALDPAFLYKFSNRHDYSNNIWATAIGSASFVTNGHGTLYGINTGYDRFIPVGESGVIVGAFGAYGYGSYTADLIKNHSHNINAGIYSRAFIGNNEIDLNIGYTIGMNNEDINTRQNIWLSSLDQNYRYNTHTMNLSANYGYVFGVKNGSLVFKPAIGLGYYLMHVGEITGDSAPINVSNAGYGNASYTFETNETAIQSPKITQNMLTLNLTLETRQYFSQGSYWFVNVGGQKDLFISSGSVTEVRFIGNGALSYKQGDMLNTHLLGTAGGEVMLGKKTFVNFALGGRAGLTYKDINITANLGARYVF